ncbi:PHP domain-containing protein [Candidatus Woesearchaeota archaeon]|nr:PHP domain-containing protein [Candidatus Woesearchaeota archaeon]
MPDTPRTATSTGAQCAVDLHTHTAASDGIYCPRELIVRAKKIGLSAIAVTDHDTVGGIPEALAAGIKENMEVIPGVEITVDDDLHQVFDIHILGLFIDCHNKKLNDLLAEGERARLQQKLKTIARLQELGYAISYPEVREYAKGSIGRPHIAAVLLKNNPKLKSREHIFAALLGNGKAAYCPRELKISLKQAIAVIHHAAGIAVLAHPLLYGRDCDKAMAAFVKEGGDAIEAYYPYEHTSTFEKLAGHEQRSRVKKVFSFASQHGLLLTGGSDFHGDHEGIVLGSSPYSESEFEKVKAWVSGRR